MQRELMEAKRAQDEARNALLRALDGYQLPEELEALRDVERQATEAFHTAFIVHEIRKVEGARV